MVDSTKRPKLVGNCIRQRREALGLSQRALGLLFDPAVTTQFISNVERGVTPLPPAHVPTLAKALQISEAEIMSLLEREYTAKLSGRLGLADASNGNGHMNGHANGSHGIPSLSIPSGDYSFMKNLYDAYSKADPKTRQAFLSVCESVLNIPKSSVG